MLWSVPIVQVILVLIQKKKKKKKKKTTRTLVWVKIPKVMPQNPPLSIFFLGKGRESFVSDFIKTKKLSVLSALPSSTQNIFLSSGTVWTTHTKKKIHTKLTQKIHFLQILHLSSNRRVRNLTLYFQFTTPARELTHRMKFECPGRHEFWTPHVSSLP